MNLDVVAREMRSRLKRMGALLDLLSGRGPLLAASLYEHRTRCGKPQCQCAKSDYRHRMWCVSFTEEGGSRTRVVASELKETVSQLTEDYRKCRLARREMRRLAEELDALAAKAERLRCREGSKLYPQLAAPVSRRND
jgi:hypothetical protein